MLGDIVGALNSVKAVIRNFFNLRKIFINCFKVGTDVTKFYPFSFFFFFGTKLVSSYFLAHYHIPIIDPCMVCFY